jgi:N-acetylmuramoyl-L-alanine amidase
MVCRCLIWIVVFGVFSLLDTGVFALTKSPDWGRLESFQGVLTKREFEHSLRQIYCPRESWYKDWIKFNKRAVLIRKKSGEDSWFKLSFSEGNQTLSVKTNLIAVDKNNSLNGIRIALDPGHIGGKYSEMEGRHFLLAGSPPVKEGELSLLVAKRLKEKLSRLGADVVLLRDQNEPVTNLRPHDFEVEAEDWVSQKESQFKIKYNTEEREKLLNKRKEVLFYRISEIHARAKLVNEVIKPNLVICLHLNAAAWSDPDKLELVERNDFHVLVNGCFMGGELADDNQRFDMIFRLVNRWDQSEQQIAESVSHALAEKTNLPAFNYKGPNALKIGEVPGVWARNLLANRSYYCPVVFLEPYVANSHDAYHRIMQGNYQGTRKVNGEPRVSLVEEYAESVFEGIKNSFTRAKN